MKGSHSCVVVFKKSFVLELDARPTKRLPNLAHLRKGGILFCLCTS